MQPPASVVRQPPLYSADRAVHGPSMNHTSTVVQSPTLSTHRSRYDTSTGYFSTVGYSTCCPVYDISGSHASTIGPPSAHSADWSYYNPSLGNVFASLESNGTMYATPHPPTVDNLYQSNMQSSSASGYPTIEVGTEDHLRPDHTIFQIQSTASIPSPQHNSLSSGHCTEVADVGATLAHGESQERGESGGLFKCLWEGCKYCDTFSSHASLMRHIKVQHVVHRSVRCPECDRVFGRKDNMRDHRRNRHRKFD
ncbi:hypothetical protein PENCOP_c010G04130 [Penicillium coprophilum]|uniref:C2H2-type domain-containing protein n=1 Tax=Penicillium coprophilum TaxID=36646 RepID=A0A1V6UGC7_9EURO|nr:hypothetical protein PENCOP_c010G04130 [Penicillium coprophilum]